MLNMDEKSTPASSTNLLSITRPSNVRQDSYQSMDDLNPIEYVDSTHSASPTSHNEKQYERESSPFSPFYNPAPTRYSLEASKSESKLNVNLLVSPYDTDVEALTPLPSKSTTGLFKSHSGNPECVVWPGQRAMKMKKKAMRVERNKAGLCGCMAGVDRKKKLWIKALIALIIVGVAIGVGVGVSKAVGGGIWKSSNNSNAPISH